MQSEEHAIEDDFLCVRHVEPKLVCTSDHFVFYLHYKVGGGRDL